MDANTHPSSSWNLAEEAKPYLEELMAQVAGSGFVTKIGMSYYDGNTIVFAVWLNRDLHWHDYRKMIPEFYRGFQVFVVGPSRKLVEHLEDPFHTMALTCVCFGLRISECLALRWSDVDWLKQHAPNSAEHSPSTCRRNKNRILRPGNAH